MSYYDDNNVVGNYQPPQFAYVVINSVTSRSGKCGLRRTVDVFTLSEHLPTYFHFLSLKFGRYGYLDTHSLSTTNVAPPQWTLYIKQTILCTYSTIPRIKRLKLRRITWLIVLGETNRINPFNLIVGSWTTIMTKQTAKKSCSGVAKPAKLAGCKRRHTSSGDTTLTSSSPLSSPPSSPIIAETTRSGTQNQILQEIEDKLGSPRISFKCPACHEKDERAVRSKPMPYFAFTQTVEGKSVPACDKPTFIRGMNSRGSLPRVLNTALEEYHTASTLRYHEVVFDFGTWDKLCHWETKAQALATEIGEDNFEHKVIFISVHSEVTRGDLFAGKDEKGEDVAVEPVESIIFMLSCGPLVTFHESISSFKKAIIHHGLDLTYVRLQPAYTVAFGADRFISAVLKSFIIAFSVRVLIQGHVLCEVITDLLDVSLELCMHSDTFFFQSKVQTTSGLPLPSSNPLSVIGIRYSWYHNHRRPWGTALPMSCPKCSSVRSWSRSKVGVDSANTIVRISTCCSPECKYEFFSYPPVGPYEVIKENKSMGWIKRTGI
ncbi:hypothetical protein F5141DRAFT_1063065 [Pisolithus sp. B1]|nr:hypothetical protein F5141DRAFT_1063065 [Pisolithus sp. B1]